MGGVKIGRILTLEDTKTEGAIQEVASQVGNNFQYGTGTPDADTPGKVYFKHGDAASSGWAEVTTVYVNTSR